MAHSVVEFQGLIDRKGARACYLTKNHMTVVVWNNVDHGSLLTVIAVITSRIDG